MGVETWWVRDFSVPIQAGPKAHPASSTMGTGCFPQVKQLVHGADYLPPSSIEVANGF